MDVTSYTGHNCNGHRPDTTAMGLVRQEGLRFAEGRTAGQPGPGEQVF